MRGWVLFVLLGMSLNFFPLTSLAAESAGQGLRVGVGITVINPFLDVPLAGYYYPRPPVGIHDDLHAKTLVFDDGHDQIVLVACDLVELPRAAVENARQRIQKSFGIPPDHILITATHSHTGPQMVPEYVPKLGHWIADSVEMAEHDKQPVQLLEAVEEEPSLPHNRRYLMKDGKVATNPGFLNPNIVEPVGPIDPRLPVLTAETPQGRRIMTWVNYSMHQDTVGGDWISADYSYYLGRMLSTFEGPDMTTIFTIGAAGDINHWNFHQPGPQRGFDTAKRLGEVLGADVLKAYTHLSPVDSNHMRAMSSTLKLPFQDVSRDDVQKAEQILSVPPPPNVDFTLDRVWATKVMKIHDSKKPNISAEVQVVTLGPLAFVGVPGELFVQLGMQIIKESPFPDTFILELANQDIGYIPTKEAFEQGGYEPTSAVFVPGGGEKIVKEALALLNQCHN
jgi:hypothetical protein